MHFFSMKKKSKEEIESVKISAEKWGISKILNNVRKKLDSIFFTLFHKIHKYNR